MCADVTTTVRGEAVRLERTTGGAGWAGSWWSSAATVQCERRSKRAGPSVGLIRTETVWVSFCKVAACVAAVDLRDGPLSCSCLGA